MFKELFLEGRKIDLRDPDDYISYADYGKMVDDTNKKRKNTLKNIAKMVGSSGKDPRILDTRWSNATKGVITLFKDKKMEIVFTTPWTGSSLDHQIIFYKNGFSENRGGDISVNIPLGYLEYTDDISQNQMINAMKELDSKMKDSGINFKYPKRALNKIKVN